MTETRDLNNMTFCDMDIYLSIYLSEDSQSHHLTLFLVLLFLFLLLFIIVSYTFIIL